MSDTRVIREDEKGVYVRTGGYVFRPRALGGYGPRKSIRYKAGDRVPARHVPGTQAARVGQERWTRA